MNSIVKHDLENIVSNNLPWSVFFNKTVLVTGANGFLPAYMVETLLYLNQGGNKRNITVVALVRNIEKAKTRFAEYLDNKQLVFLEQDVCADINIDRKIDFVIHAASQASPKYYGIDPVGTLSANVLGTLNLMNLAKKHQVESFLYFSSGEVYGQVEEAHNPVIENYYGYLDPMTVRACYGESKRMGENICVSYFHQFGVNAKVVRPFHTYGPGMALNDGRVYADFVSDVVNGKDIEMKSDGSARRAFCYLKDATVAFFTVLLKGEPGEAYNVGNPDEEHSIIELAEAVVKLGKTPLKIIKQPVLATNNYLKSPLLRNTPNIDKLKSLGWSPDTDITTGFAKTISSYLT